jgi:hypothetical protein
MHLVGFKEVETHLDNMRTAYREQQESLLLASLSNAGCENLLNEADKEATRARELLQKARLLYESNNR